MDATTQEAIEAVAESLQHLAYGPHEAEDIRQDVWMLSLEALEKVDIDEIRDLHAFIYKHCWRKLASRFHREMGDDQRKRDLMGVSESFDECGSTPGVDELLAVQEIVELIDLELPAELRADYRRFAENARMNKYRKRVIKNEIRTIAMRAGLI